MAVQRKTRRKSKDDKSVQQHGAQDLEEELNDHLKEYSTVEVTKQKHTAESIIATRKKPPKRKSRCGLFKHIFDCVWTAVLLLIVFVVIFKTCPFVKKHVTAIGHSRVYPVSRSLRLLFISVQPYLVGIGLDFTQSCLVLNPFANSSMQCPCINDPNPIIVQLNQQRVPQEILNDLFNPYVLKNALSIEEEYGRSTLVRFFNETGQLPDICLQSGSTEEPIEYHSFTDDMYWNKLLQSEDLWSFTWYVLCGRSSLNHHNNE